MPSARAGAWPASPKSPPCADRTGPWPARPPAAEDALVLLQELAAGPDIDEAPARYASRRRPRTAHVQETTAMRNGLAALPLEDRVGFVVPRWAELSTASFAALAPTP